MGRIRNLINWLKKGLKKPGSDKPMLPGNKDRNKMRDIRDNVKDIKSIGQTINELNGNYEDLFNIQRRCIALYEILKEKNAPDEIRDLLEKQWNNSDTAKSDIQSEYIAIPKFSDFGLRNKESVNIAVKSESGNIKTGKRDNGNIFYEWESESDIPQSYAKDNVKKVYSVEITPQKDYIYTEKEGYQKDSKSDYVFNLIHLIKKQQGGKVSEIYEKAEGIEYRVQLEDNNTEHVTVSGIINDKYKEIEYTRNSSKQGIQIPKKYEWYNNDNITRDYFETGDTENLDKALKERDKEMGEHN